ncbi:hypothetical protein GIB67_021435, partial [Kingdonia uniflora]
ANEADINMNFEENVPEDLMGTWRSVKGNEFCCKMLDKMFELELMVTISNNNVLEHENCLFQIVPITILTWHKVKPDVQDRLWEMVKQKFIVPEEARKLTLMSMGKDWREFKVEKRKIININDEYEQALKKCLEDVPYNQWEVFAKHCTTSNYKELSRILIETRNKHKLPHTCSRLGYPRLEHEMNKEIADDATSVVKKVRRSAVWTRARKRKNGEAVNELVLEKISNQGNAQDEITPPESTVLLSSLVICVLVAFQNDAQLVEDGLPINKKSGSVKLGASRKGKGGGLLKASRSVKHEDVEPSEMSLDEIESRLGSLLQANTISQLKSGVWKKRLEGEGVLYGVDVNTGGITDSFANFIWEPAVVKINALIVATEVACLVLSVDEMVKNPEVYKLIQTSRKAQRHSKTLSILAVKHPIPFFMVVLLVFLCIG